MTWLSRLLPHRRARQARAGVVRGRPRSAGARRRIMSLEALERRTVLSNVLLSLSSSGVLTITGDVHDDSFSITESATGVVTVAPTSIWTTIDGTRWPVVTPPKVAAIVLNLPGTSNVDSVTLRGPGKATATTLQSVAITATAPSLTLSASGLDVAGALTLSDIAGPPGLIPGVFHVKVDDSAFKSLTISQDGGAPASVELGGDTTGSGPVTVTEGNAASDSIVLDTLNGVGDAFGSTTLIQGAGPAFPGGTGAADSVSVTGASVADLTIRQILDGAGDSIVANRVAVALTSFGVVASQGNGGGNRILLGGITSPTPTSLAALGKSGPPGITIRQGDGNADDASVTTTNLPGNITINQGNGDLDAVVISGVNVGFRLTSGGKTTGYYGNITVHQGTGEGDTVQVTKTTAVGKITTCTHC